MKHLLLLLILFSCTKTNEGNIDPKSDQESDAQNNVSAVMSESDQPISSSIGEQPQEQKNQMIDIRDEILDAFMKKGFAHRDSGEPVDRDFLKSCANKLSSTKFEFSCSDLTVDYQAAIVGNLVYLIQNGESVESRAAFKITNGTVESINDPIEKIFTEAYVAKLLNKKYKVNDYNEEKIKAFAHSYYRTELPETPNGEMIIKSGELGYGSDHGYQPIAKITWQGKEPKIVEIKE